jgi:hypothetical protein
MARGAMRRTAGMVVEIIWSGWIDHFAISAERRLRLLCAARWTRL